MISLDSLATAAQVSPEDWSRVNGPKTIYSSRGWHLAAEQHDHFRPAYLAARRDGMCQGVLAAYRVAPGANPRYDPGVVFADLFEGRLGGADGWTPGLVGGSRSGYLTQLMIDPSLAAPDRHEVLGSLLRGFWELADRQGVAAGWFMYMPRTDATELATVMRKGSVLLLTSADLQINVRWRSFDEYVGSLSPHRRWAVRREIRSFARDGVSVSTTALGETWEALWPLFASVQAKHGRPLPPARAASYLGRQAAFLGPESTVFLCERAGRPVGFSLFYRAHQTLFARLVGFTEHDVPRYAYFNLLFYHPIAFAIENGLRAVHLGIEGFEAKIGRGARPRSLWSVLGRTEESDRWQDGLEQRCRSWNASWAAKFVARFGVDLADAEDPVCGTDGEGETVRGC